MNWTTAQIAEVARLWSEGRSASQIAVVLCVTRNAVIGVVHRQKMPSRMTRVRAPATLVPPAEKQHRQRGKTFALANGWRPPIFRSPIPVKARPVPQDFLGVSLLDLAWVDGIPANCRYAHGDGPFVFCGQDVQQHSSYCPEHHRICYGRPAATPEQLEKARKMRAAKNRIYGAANGVAA